MNLHFLLVIKECIGACKKRQTFNTMRAPTLAVLAAPGLFRRMYRFFITVSLSNSMERTTS